MRQVGRLQVSLFLSLSSSHQNLTTPYRNHVYDHGCDKKPPPAANGRKTVGISVVKRGGKETSSKANGKASASTSANAAANDALLQQLKQQSTEASAATALDDLCAYLQAAADVTAAEGAKPLWLQAFSSEAKKVRELALAQAQKEVERRGEGGKEAGLEALEQCLRSSIEGAVGAKLSSVEERQACSLAALYAVAAAKLPGVNPIEDLCAWSIKAQSDKLQKALATALRSVHELRPEEQVLAQKVELLRSNLLAGISAESRRNGHALLVVTMVSALGLGPSGRKEELALTIQACLEALRVKPKSMKDNEAAVIGALKVVHCLSREVGERVSPYFLEAQLVELLVVQLYSNVSSNIRSPLKKSMVQYVKVLSSYDLDAIVPVLLTGLEANAWRTKALALGLLGQLGRRDLHGLSRHLPAIVPVVMDCSSSIKKEVSEAASLALEDLASVIRNPETVKLKPFLLNALKDPEKVEACLDEIMDCTFVNSIDKESLALMVPVVFRAMREGNADLKQKSAITTGNICSLVADVNHIRPFVPMLLPELNKLLDHSNPNVRKFSVTAKNTLLEGLGDSDETSNAVPKAISQVLQKDVEVILGEATLKLDEVELRYLVHVIIPLVLTHAFAEVDPRLPSAMVAKHVDAETKLAIGMLVPGGSPQADQVSFTICEAWLKAHSRRSRNVSHMSALSVDESQEKDYLVYLPSIILAFASKMLLKRTVLKLERNHRYAFVGQNGVGKTTLLDRIAAQDINGFPTSVTCYYVQHEILSEDKELSVVGYMNRLIGDNVAITPEKIQASLDKVGFSSELKSTAVANLSGGWRMRLAIARSMLYDAKLLLLDEPTNHLDAEAIEWLQSYLSALSNTTIALVSHDYDFLAKVATDIVHIADMKLTYYDCGFTEFQQQRPEIVAALPKPNKPSALMSTAAPVADGETEEEGLSALEALSLGPDDERFQAVIKSIKPIRFPEGQKLDGITSRGKPVMSLTDVSFRYPNTDRFILENVNLRLNLNSRVVLVGANGAGKSTLLKVLIGMEDVVEEHGNKGKVWRHHNLRSAYIAQHSMHHLESNLEQSPCQYIQSRFWEGRDKEVSKMMTLSLTPEEEALLSERGEICEILSRVKRGKKLYYEIKKNGRKMKEGNTEFKTIEELESLGKPHAVKLCRMFDEKLKASASGMDIRPLTTPEMIKHLKEFGIPEDLATRKIRWMSGGQKSRLVLAAAMWSKPHLIALDEPTNYLDNETLAALTYALKSFRGGVVAISHHPGFVSALAKELWHVQGGAVTVENVKKKPAK